MLTCYIVDIKLWHNAIYPKPPWTSDDPPLPHKLAVIRSPKSIELPVDIIVRYSIIFECWGLEVVVTFITVLIDDAHAAAPPAFEFVKVPKSIAFPSVAIVE